MAFRRLSLRNWRQFAEVNIEFHDRVTIITGVNGAGKSTLLKILARHFGWPTIFLAAPLISKEGIKRFFAGLFGLKEKAGTTTNVGSITYADGRVASLEVVGASDVQYELQIQNQQTVDGLYIGSHRPALSYHRVVNIPTDVISAEKAFENYRAELISRYQHSGSRFSPIYRMKEALISMAMFGLGNENVQPNSKLAEIYNNFKEVLRTVLPPALKFKDLSIRVPDVVFVTETGDFVLDDASGGIMSIFELAWQIHLFSIDKQTFTILIDEPENHLHPAMQRTLLERLVKAFPNGQFIVVSHSPFVVSSVRDSYVYVMSFASEQSSIEAANLTRVVSLRLDIKSRAGTASEILREVLGVPVTLPVWAEDKLVKIAQNYRIEELNGDLIARLRGELEVAGLGEFYPDALERIGRAKQ